MLSVLSSSRPTLKLFSEVKLLTQSEKDATQIVLFSCKHWVEYLLSHRLPNFLRIHVVVVEIFHFSDGLLYFLQMMLFCLLCRV